MVGMESWRKDEGMEVESEMHCMLGLDFDCTRGVWGNR